jgi:short-chain fatty acids transporter
MLSRIGLGISAVLRRIMPDPFVIAVLLTGATVALALWRMGVQPVRPDRPPGLRGVAGDLWWLTGVWGGDTGLWQLLAFSMQMCLVLVTGHALASTRPVGRAIRALSGVPRSGGQAAALVGLVACTTAVINWGLGLIVGALLAREVGQAMARRGAPVHYPLLAAAGYTGLMVWHGGLSGSAPLSMTTPAGAAKVLPKLPQFEGLAIPLTDTLATPMNLTVTIGLLVMTPIVLWLLNPRAHASSPPRLMQATTDPSAFAAAEAGEAREPFAERMDRMHLFSLLLAGALIAALVRFAITRSLWTIGLNEVNTAMLALGLLLHGSLRRYAAAVEHAIRGCAGILLQFPIYAGIMGVLVASGLGKWIALEIGQRATAETLPLFTFISAGVLNMFVPSGGGQWAVQGPIALESAAQLGVPPGKVVMAVAYGDQITNMLQVFWALPLLAITGARARDVVGYTAVVMCFAFMWVGLCLVVF